MDVLWTVINHASEWDNYISMPMEFKMTNQERAEKIVDQIQLDYVSDEPKVIALITSQLDEAVRKAYTKGFYEGQEGLFQRGFASAREKAAGILAKQISWCADHCQTGDSCDCIDKAAECILALEPEEKR